MNTVALFFSCNCLAKRDAIPKVYTVIVTALKKKIINKISNNF